MMQRRGRQEQPNRADARATVERASFPPLWRAFFSTSMMGLPGERSSRSSVAVSRAGLPVGTMTASGLPVGTCAGAVV